MNYLTIILIITIIYLLNHRKTEKFSNEDFFYDEIKYAVKHNLIYEEFLARIDKNPYIKVYSYKISPKFFMAAIMKYSTGTLSTTWLKSMIG